MKYIAGLQRWSRETCFGVTALTQLRADVAWLREIAMPGAASGQMLGTSKTEHPCFPDRLGNSGLGLKRQDDGVPTD